MIDSSAPPPQFTPVNLITGFLGSGKTTLLKRMLASPALADTAVLINEFGEIGLDHDLLERVDENTILLQSGCLCCTIRGELAAAIHSLDARRARGEVPVYRRLLIESTGLADPLPILTTVTADSVLRHHYRLGLVIATVDAINGMGHLDRQPKFAGTGRRSRPACHHKDGSCDEGRCKRSQYSAAAHKPGRAAVAWRGGGHRA